jgi:SOS response regulatory protein OraA/RecX
MADAYTTALRLLASRELSAAQLRAKLLRRRFEPDAVEAAIDTLSRDGSLDDGRVARAAARLEASVRHRGRARVVQRVRQLGIAPDVVQAAVAEVFADVDEAMLLDRALERRLRGAELQSLDRRALSRLVRSLLSQGFSSPAIQARLRARGTSDDKE